MNSGNGFPGTARGIRMLLAMAAVAGIGAACAPLPDEPGPRTAQTRGEAPVVLDLGAAQGIEELVAGFDDDIVVFVGETHDRYGHHLNQLAVIRAVHGQHPDLTIGVEFLQQPFQSHVDAYIAGDIDEKQFLRATEYYSRWRFDYRLYRPIFRYAREHRIPVVALNLPKELTDAVSNVGIDGLTEADRARIPAPLQRDDEAYRQRLKAIYEQHPHGPESNFERFVEVQLLWDEGMADRAARHLAENPDTKMVILAGSGHIAHGDGIPQRLSRRTGRGTAIFLNELNGEIKPRTAHYLLLSEPISLPPPGRLGIYMGEREDRVIVSAFPEDSAAREQGLLAGDQLVKVAGQPIRSAADVKIALLDRGPGDSVEVRVARDKDETDVMRTFSVQLR